MFDPAFDLKLYGFTGEITVGDDNLVPGRVVELRRERYTCVSAYGEIPAVLKGGFVHRAKASEDFPTVGDFVLFKYNENGSSPIVRLLPRISKFSRSDFGGHIAGYAKNAREQVVAANFDYVFIVSSLNRDFNLNRIARYLTAAWQSGGFPVVVLTKADLCVDGYDAQVAAARELAGAAPVIPVSSYSGFGLSALESYLAPAKTAVLLGSSGVGKSSLLNALAGEELMAVKGIREDDSRGRHTTTHRQLATLPSGAFVIDTPGMRELGLWDAGEGIAEAFPDVEALFSRCRFSDCGHRTEPGCAVLAALEDGSLSRETWERYQAQKRESAFTEDKAAYLNGKKEWHKSLTKLNRKREKGDF
jgi:ribosome biogenesis GTPase